jgi:hypothetical protein
MNNPMPAAGYQEPAPYREGPNPLNDAALFSLCDFVLDHWRSFIGPHVQAAALLRDYQSPLEQIDLIESHADESDGSEFWQSRLTSEIGVLVTEATARAIEMGWKQPA